MSINREIDKKKKDVVYMYNEILAIKRMKHAIWSNMDGPKIIILSKVSQTKKVISYDMTYVEYKKMIKINLIM